jgi:LemA protein
MALAMTGLTLATICCVVFIRGENRLSLAVAKVDESWSGIQIQLQRRHEMTPQLVAVARSAKEHDLALLDRILQAQKLAAGALHKGQQDEVALAENALARELALLMASIGNTRPGTASQSLVLLQQQLEETADQIAAAQRLHNGNVAGLNALISGLPGRWLAKQRGLQSAIFLELSERDRMQVQIPPKIEL